MGNAKGEDLQKILGRAGEALGRRGGRFFSGLVERAREAGLEEEARIVERRLGEIAKAGAEIVEDLAAGGDGVPVPPVDLRS